MPEPDEMEGQEAFLYWWGEQPELDPMEGMHEVKEWTECPICGMGNSHLPGCVGDVTDQEED